MVFKNNFKGAIVTEKGKGGVMAINDKTKREMSSKHPRAEQISQEALLTGEAPPSLHPTFYSTIDADLVKKCALRTKGAAGVSQQEDALWHKMVTTPQIPYAMQWPPYHAVLQSICRPKGEDLLANRGIAIDKCPGLRPVGVRDITENPRQNYAEASQQEWSQQYTQ